MTAPADITAVILAGGLGTRLRSVVADRSKVVAEVNGKPFLHYLFDQILAAGIRKAVLCTGYLADHVRHLLGEQYGELSLSYSVEQEPLGTGGALRLALPMLESDPVLVMNGDSYCDVDLKSVIVEHTASGAEASLVLTLVSDINRYGAVDVDSSSKVVAFEEKGSRTGSGLINAGIYLMPRSVIAAMAPGCPVSLERDVFPELLVNHLHGFQSTSRFIDIGVPEDYAAATVFFTTNTHCEVTA